jgi:iron complex transport system ATP-binding protein
LLVRAGGTPLLVGVDLDVAPGEVVAVLGPNGAGKSTLLGALAGDIRLAAGTVRLGGHDLAALSPAERARARAVLRQRSLLAAPFTALEVVRLGQARPDDATAHAQLEAVELGAFAARLYPSLSGGEQQRVQLARVLAQLAETPGAALLLDEPTAALDLRQAHLVGRLARAAASRGHPVVVVAHGLELAAAFADRVVLLRAGTVLAHGSPTAALTSAAVSAAFGLDVVVEHDARGLRIISGAASPSPMAPGSPDRSARAAT